MPFPNSGQFAHGVGKGLVWGCPQPSLAPLLTPVAALLTGPSPQLLYPLAPCPRFSASPPTGHPGPAHPWEAALAGGDSPEAAPHTAPRCPFPSCASRAGVLPCVCVQPFTEEVSSPKCLPLLKQTHKMKPRDHPCNHHHWIITKQTWQQNKWSW